MQNRYFILVDGDVNANKWYKIEVRATDLLCSWGRVGQKTWTHEYPHSEYNRLVRDKLVKKGYKDYTDKVAVATIGNDTLTDNPIINNIIQRLMNYQKTKIDRTYVLEAGAVTQAMIDEATSLVNNLSSRLPLQTFNKLLTDIFSILPRKMEKVSNYLANEQSHLLTIVERENDLLKMLKQQVIQNHLATDKIAGSLLDQMGLSFSLPSDDEVGQIKKWLASHSDKYSQAVNIIHKASRTNYEKWLIEKDVKETRTLWHGSRNENWWSIIGSALSLNPKAVITGKMFGHGIYFANSADKSLGYTSYNGSRWANGDSSLAYLGLFDIAYGNPHIVYDHYNYMGDFTEEVMMKKYGKNVLHASADKGMLRKDEIIVFNENQTTIKHLVEIKGN